MDVLNPWMLFGLAGIAVPILVHLLSRRRQDIVDWGAMQFLEPKPKERRSLWIENFWLMLLRIGLICVLALALARPWLNSVWLARWTSARPQDVALIVDGSYSLDRAIGNRTVGDAVRRLAQTVLDQLDAADTVQVYDARETPRPELASYVRDRTAAGEALLDLPPPSGSSDLVAALSAAMRDLLRTGNLDREIVVVTDGQAVPWRVNDASAWQALDALRLQSRVPPRIWVLETNNSEGQPHNLAIGPVEVSRERVMPGGRVSLQAPIRLQGSQDPVSCDVFLEINGIKSPAHSTTVRVPGDGEAQVAFEVALDRPGCHAIRMVLEYPDNLPTDNRADAVIDVASGWPVLLVDGAPQGGGAQSELFFATAALDTGESGWLRPSTCDLNDWKLDDLGRYEAVVLANVAALSQEQIDALTTFVESGGGVLVTVGDQTQPAVAESESPWQEWLPVRPVDIAGDPMDEAAWTTITRESLELPWQEAFRKQRSGGFCDVRFQRWWRTELKAAEDAADNAQLDPQVIARFATGDPSLVWQRRGNGTVAVWTSTLDADWNQLPSKPDYVAWWHEVLFALLEPAVRRNVLVGEPLLAIAPAGETTWHGRFVGPRGPATESSEWNSGDRRGHTTSDTRFPGVYAFLPQQKGGDERDLAARLVEGVADAYAVQANVRESDLTPLTEADRAVLTNGRPLQFIKSADELQGAWLGDAGRTELTPMLLYVLLGFLVVETWMTRRLVRRGSGERL